MVREPDPLIATMPPHEPEAERQFIGRVLLETVTFGDLEIDVSPEWFSQPWYGLCWRAILYLQRRDEPVNLVSVFNAMDGLQGDGTNHAHRIAVTSEAVADLWNAAPSSANVNYYAKAIRDAWCSRQLALVGRRITNLGLLSDMRDLDSKFEEAERILFDLTSMTLQDAREAVPSDLMELVMKRLDRLREGTPPGVRSGYESLDDILRGFQPGEMSLIAGRPSMGKTTAASCFLRRMARNGDPVGFVSLETPNEQIGINWLAARAELDSRSLRDGFVPQDLPRPLIQVMDHISELDPFWRCIDKGVKTVLDVRRVARMWSVRHKTKVLCVDYLQLLKSGTRRQSRENEISEVSRELKQIAMDVGIHVMAVAQLNRNVESRRGNEPQMSDLRDSGQLEQDADVIILIHRPGYYDEDKDPTETHFIVAKNRNGASGRTTLIFKREHNNFFEEDDAETHHGGVYDPGQD